MPAPISLPRLKIGAELGHGANSVVYRAELDGTPCAFKLPRTKGPWTRWVYREAVALARVQDPGLPAVLEVGEADGLPYLAMELVEGETLADHIARAPLARDKALELIGTVLRALDRVHAAGLVHRDVKPKNLVLCPDGRTKLVDFGFATPIERGIEGDPEMAGTPAYAAPEQLRPPARVDARADLYAVGVVLFECLSGRLPRHGEVASENLSADEGVNVVLTGLLAAEPEGRYASARAVLADLERVKIGRPPLGPSAYAAPTTAAPLVGREFESSRLAERFAMVRSTGSIVLVRGMRGAGKTRLVSAAHDAWTEPGRVRTLATTCREGDPPWAALRRLFEAFLGVIGRATGPDRSAIEEALRRAAEGHLGALAALVSPALGEIVGAKAEGQAPPSIAEGLTELLVRLVRRVGPILVSVDDLQWIDPPSREVFARLAHRVQEVPLVLLLAARVDAAGEVPVDRFRANELPRAEVLDLGSLDRADVSALVTAHLGGITVDAEAIQRVDALSDGTPLGILEVLGAMLDTGALRPQRGAWRLDRDRAERVALPAGAVALLGRRLGELPPATVRVLEQASVLGAVFEDALLAAVLGMLEHDVGFALADARRAGVLVADGTERHRFVHDGIREIVLARLADSAVRAAHQRAAEALMRAPRASLEILFAAATHYASGELDVAPSRGYAAARRAASAALEQYDNENALRFLKDALIAAARAGIPLDVDYHRSAGEAQLRLGALGESLSSFEAALPLAETAHDRAEILGRMAWVHQTAAEADRAWERLSQAFEAIGAQMPIENARSAGATLGKLARLGGRAIRAFPSLPPSPDASLLCDLHYQNARLALEYAKPARLVQSTIQTLDLSAGMGPSRAQARMLAMRGLVLTAMGRHKRGAIDLAAARQMADSIDDPSTGAFALQLQAVAASFAGDVTRAVELERELVDERGHWLELHELCLNVGTAEILEAMRGRAKECQTWLDRVLVRLQRSGRSTAAFDEMLGYRVRAARATAGLPWNDGPPLATPRGFLRMSCWGARIRCYVETGDLGPEFDALVREFEADRYDTKTAHIVLGEYYLAIVHARIHQGLRAAPAERGRHIAALQRALTDLAAAARIPLQRVHHTLGEAYVAFFTGKPDEAMRIAAKAEAVARDETCPWVLYGCARLRAHVLLAAGRRDVALDEARVAETFALQHGAVWRARWIREELSLPEPDVVGHVSETSGRGSIGGARYLTALLQVARAGLKDLRLEPQATAILDELLRDVDASRGFFWLRTDPSRGSFGAIGRTREGETLRTAGDRLEGLFRSVLDAQAPWPESDDARTSIRASAGWMPGLDPRRSVALPMMLGDKPVGVLFIARGPEQPAISAGLRRVLAVLVHQVALALEISRLLEERDRLQKSLQQAQKMEAVGRLAGGVAHDINNMLQVTQGSLERLRMVGVPGAAAEDVRILFEGTDRAQQLVRQLLTFSRARAAARERMHLHEVVLRNEALMRTLLGKVATLDLRLEARAPWVVVDPTLLEQSLFNLVINARDALGDRGGTLTIATENVHIGDAVPAGPQPGHHILLTATDNGHGMSEEVAARVFEPFFTTKSGSNGTGLGLATVYGFVQSASGHIEVQSRPGEGARFSIYLPTTPPSQKAVADAPVRGSVLVVDDEELVVNSLRRVLEAAGHRVLIALNESDALDVARKHQPDIALALVDVRLADTTGPQLVRKLWELEVPRKVIYMTGHLPEELTREIGDAQVVDKPFSSADLLRRVELLKNS